MGAKHSGWEIGWLGYNISTQAHSRYDSHAAVLGSEIPRQVLACSTYLLMISVISLQPIFTVMRFALVDIACVTAIPMSGCQDFHDVSLLRRRMRKRKSDNCIFRHPPALERKIWICACSLKQIPAKKVVMNECRYVEHASTW